MPWGNLFGKQKKYDKDGNEIDDQGNIVAPALGVQAPAGGGLQMPSSMGDYVAQIAPDAAGPSVGSGAMSGAGTGAALGGTLGSIVPGVGNVIGTAAGTILGAVGGAVNASGEEKKAAEEHTQKVRDAQAEQQRMDQLLNYKRGQDTQKVGFEGLDFLSREADRARLASMGVGYRNAMSRALGY